MREIVGRHDEKEVSLLSNANLNIIKILNTCANEDILNDSSYITDGQKEKTTDRITKLKNRINSKESPTSKNNAYKSKKKVKRALYLTLI